MTRLQLLQPTWLKELPIESTILKPEQKVKVEVSIEVDSVLTWGNHLRVVSNGKVSYLFTGHVKLPTTPILPYVQPGAIKTSIVRACDAYGLSTTGQKAYVLATIHHETGNTFKPIEEYFGRSQAIKLGYSGGANYFGRGYIQITHDYNYERFGKILGIDLLKNPNLALDASIALFIAIYGFKHGTFTGLKLEKFVNSTKKDYINARRVINGTDRARLIADLATSYYNQVLNGFTTGKKATTPPTYYGVNPSKITLDSQRDNKADRNRDGKDDSFQTCNVHACKMAIQALTGKVIPISELDNFVINKPGSRYSHANLVELLAKYGVKSKFSTTTTTIALHNHLKSGGCAIWSNKLTHSGHIVLIAGFDTQRNAYKIFDSWGEPFPNGSGGWKYIPSNEPYWLSVASFNRSGMNGVSAKNHWLHLCS